MTRAAGDRANPDPDAYTEAAEWLLILRQPDVTNAQIREFTDWVEIEENRQAFDFVERAWNQDAALRRIRRLGASEIRKADYDGSVSVAAHLAHRQAVAPRSWSLLERLRRIKSWMLAAALTGAVCAMIVAAVTISFPHMKSAQLDAYETGTAQHREIRLADGSIVTLGAETSLSVSYAADKREIVLKRGAALFEVSHDKRRPFLVLAGRGQVRALGTVFAIRRYDDEVVVNVAEGRVQVDEKPTPLQPSMFNQRLDRSLQSVKTAVLVQGECISFGGHGTLGMVERTDAKLAIAWRSGLLVYRDEPLRHVIRDVGRYSQRSITISDPAIEELRFTGIVRVDQGQSNIDQWLSGLKLILPVEAAAGDQTISLRLLPSPRR